MNRFEGKNVLITGAASGIGKACALRLAAEGGRIWCADMNLAGAEETVADIKQDGGVAKASQLDVCDYAACDSLIQALLAEWGQLHVLCNIAGIGGMRRFEEETPEQFSKMLSVNLVGPFNLCRAAITSLLEVKGNIVNLASVAGKIGQAYTASYVASKHGVVGLTKSLAMEYGRQGLRANAVCPGAVNTPLIGSFASFPEGIDASLVDRYNFLPWFSEPDEVAAMIAYVASDEAKYVNGAVLSIDGGITCG